MRSVIRVIAVILVSNFLLAACTHTGTSGLTSPEAGTYTTPTPVPQGTVESVVSIQDDTFSPQVIAVRPGDIVTWTNQDPYQHDLSGFGIQRTLLPGESYSHTFQDVGTFNYESSGRQRMEGVVLVQDTEELDPTASPSYTPQPSPDFEIEFPEDEPENIQIKTTRSR